MSNKYGFDLKWFYSLATTILGFFVAKFVLSEFPTFYFYSTITMFAFCFSGLCLKIYERFNNDKDTN